MAEPIARHDYSQGGLEAALEFLKRTRAELRSPPQRGPVQMRTCLLKGRFTERLLDFQDGLELEAGVERQLGDAQHEPGVLSPVAVELDHELRGPLHDLERIEEPGSGRDVPHQPDDAPHPIELTAGRAFCEGRAVVRRFIGPGGTHPGQPTD